MCPNSWKKVIKFACDNKDGLETVGFGKFVTIATVGILSRPSMIARGIR